MHIKGKGKMTTYFLKGKLEPKEVSLRHTVLRTEKKDSPKSTSSEEQVDLHAEVDLFKAILNNQIVNRWTLSFVESETEPHFKQKLAQNSRYNTGRMPSDLTRKFVATALGIQIFFHICDIVAQYGELTQNAFNATVFFALKGAIIVVLALLMILIWRIPSFWERYMQYISFTAAAAVLSHILLCKKPDTPLTLFQLEHCWMWTFIGDLAQDCILLSCLPNCVSLFLLPWVGRLGYFSRSSPTCREQMHFLQKRT